MIHRQVVVYNHLQRRRRREVVQIERRMLNLPGTENVMTGAFITCRLLLCLVVCLLPSWELRWCAAWPCISHRGYTLVPLVCSEGRWHCNNRTHTHTQLKSHVWFLSFLICIFQIHHFPSQIHNWWQWFYSSLHLVLRHNIWENTTTHIKV